MPVALRSHDCRQPESSSKSICDPPAPIRITNKVLMIHNIAIIKGFWNCINRQTPGCETDIGRSEKNTGLQASPLTLLAVLSHRKCICHDSTECLFLKKKSLTKKHRHSSSLKNLNNCLKEISVFNHII